MTEFAKLPTANYGFPGWIRAQGFMLEDGGTPMLPSAMDHCHATTWSQSGTATSVTLAAHVFRASGTILSIAAGSIVANVGDSEVTFDLKKNGTTVLTGVITLTSTHTAYEIVAGVLSATSADAGDVLTLVVTATDGVGSGHALATGCFAELRVNEDYA